MIKKIIQVTILHYRYDTRIYQKISKSLAKKYNVILLCADGKGNEVKNSIEILDLGILKKNNFFLRILLNFKLIVKCFSLKGDYYHFHDPELIFAGILLRLFNYKVIFDSHEHIPDDIIDKYYIPKNIKLITSSIYASLEKLLLKFYSGLIGATPYIRDHLKKMNNNVIDICNYPILDNLIASNEKAAEQSKYFNYICYIGAIAKIRGIYELVQALELTKNKVILNLAGDFAPASFERELKNLPGWKHVNYLGFLKRQQVNEVLGKSVAGIVTFFPAANHINAQPNKMFEYMAAGIPVIASNFSLWREIIEGNQCGICVDPHNSKAIGDAMQYLIDNPKEAKQMGKNGRKAVEQKYNWPIEEKKLLTLYKDLLQ